MDCDTCAYYEYDEDWESWLCSADVDEDEAVRIMTGQYKGCPFYRNGDEYAVVRHQI